MKKIIVIFLLFIGQGLFSQIKDEVRELKKINEKYYFLLKQYTSQNKKSKKETFFINHIDSLQQQFYKEELSQLQKIKETENNNYQIPVFITNLCNSGPAKISYKKPDFEKYLPRDYFSISKRYQAQGKEIRTTVTFIVEKNGNVAFVRAEGGNKKFNEEAELQIYNQMIYMPKCVDGIPERSRFKMPIVLGLKD